METDTSGIVVLSEGMDESPEMVALCCKSGAPTALATAQ